jgi:ABC-type multidrug transport system fused ATPase/permease subunit
MSGSNIHGALLRSVLSAPIPTFFDTHTIGEILNRFGKDVEVVDSSVPETLLQCLINWSQVLSIFALCIWASPYFAIVLAPLILGFYYMYKYFSNVSQALKKLESVSRSPIYASLSETLMGLETIRAYGDTDRFCATHLTRMDRNQKFFFHMWMCMSWVTVRLELATSFILLALALLSVCLRESVSPVALGLALSYGLQLTALFQRCVQISIDMSNYMTSTERLFEYLDIPQESSLCEGPSVIANGEDGMHKDEQLGLQPDVERGDYEMVPVDRTSLTAASEAQLAVWPETGSIEFRDVWMQYRDNPPVLKGISFTVRKGERIGVCGRTGAGKSSVMTVLFRVVELTRGHILIDGLDIASVPLSLLRSKLAIIPQDPVLFTGSVRYQLDPFEQFSDTQVWEALEMVNMGEAVRAMGGRGILEQVKENGENLSQGQRQLLCIARALLRQTKILIVDEGTSAVDPFTDELIQKVLREVADRKGTTVLAIAHRLQTIVDFDRILVLGYGHVLEFDEPQTLLSDPQSVFATMIREADH